MSATPKQQKVSLGGFLANGGKTESEILKEEAMLQELRQFRKNNPNKKNTNDPNEALKLCGDLAGLDSLLAVAKTSGTDGVGGGDPGKGKRSSTRTKGKNKDGDRDILKAQSDHLPRPHKIDLANPDGSNPSSNNSKKTAQPSPRRKVPARSKSLVSALPTNPTDSGTDAAATNSNTAVPAPTPTPTPTSNAIAVEPIPRRRVVRSKSMDQDSLPIGAKGRSSGTGSRRLRRSVSKPQEEGTTAAAAASTTTCTKRSSSAARRPSLTENNTPPPPQAVVESPTTVVDDPVLAAQSTTEEKGKEKHNKSKGPKQKQQIHKTAGLLVMLPPDNDNDNNHGRDDDDDDDEEDPNQGSTIIQFDPRVADNVVMVRRDSGQFPEDMGSLVAAELAELDELSDHDSDDNHNNNNNNNHHDEDEATERKSGWLGAFGFHARSKNKDAGNNNMNDDDKTPPARPSSGIMSLNPFAHTDHSGGGLWGSSTHGAVQAHALMDDSEMDHFNN